MKTEFAEGGTIVSIHSPDMAVVWLEAHYDDPVLQSIRSRDLGGPLAAMLSPDEPVLVIFGSILDDWVLKTGKVLSEVSGFPVMIRTLKDNPVPNWMEANGSPQRADTGVLVDTDESDNDLGESTMEDSDQDTASIESVDSIGRTSSVHSIEQSDSVTSGRALRLRGGAGGDDEFIPWMSPVHILDVELHICLSSTKEYRVNIPTKIQVKYIKTLPAVLKFAP